MPNINECSVEKKVRQVEEQTICLKTETDVLHDRIGELTGRLGTVLRPQPEAEDIGKPLVVELVSLAAGIRESASSVSNARVRIEDILSRLEL